MLWLSRCVSEEEEEEEEVAGFSMLCLMDSPPRFTPSLSPRQQQLLDELPRSAARHWLKVTALPRRCAGAAHCLL